MKYVEIIADETSTATVIKVADKVKVQDLRLGMVGEDGMRQMRILVSDDKIQPVLDILQGLFGAQPTAHIIVLDVETALPKADDEEREQEDAATAAREALYAEVERNARCDRSYTLLVLLSTVVAAIGLVEDSVAVVIGAMVIAPLLGPNLALSMGTALGDGGLIRKAVKTLVTGLALAISLSAAVGFFWPESFHSHELLARTEAGLDSVALALASGAAAALSLTTGLSSVLVGVMVAVALLPPAATVGLMLGQGQMDLALGAGLLLALNIVCVNLISKIVFFAQGIRPRTWVEKEKARRATILYGLGWLISLGVLLFFIHVRRSM